MAPLVLVVDDDGHIRDVVRFALEKAGFRVNEAGDGRQALALFASEPPEAVVLDVMMPEMDGTEVCRELRRHSRVPIIFLSSRDEDVDRIVGLELGGDDYVGKPFSPRELVARVRAVLRRTVPTPQELAATNPSVSAGARPAKRTLTHGPLCLDLDTYEVAWQAQALALTVTEFGLLRTLLARPGKVFTRDELMNGAYDEPVVVSDRTIDSHVRRLRQKLAAVGADPIRTVFGVGYQLAPSVGPAGS
jgi:two-component system OmpR family response regulator